MTKIPDYVDAVKRTENTDYQSMSNRLQDKELVRLLHAGVGVSTEANEFLDTLKKTIFYGKELDKINLREELSDMLYYITMALDELGFTMEEVMAKNMEKLKARYGDKFTEQAALNRDLNKERSILEDK